MALVIDTLLTFNWVPNPGQADGETSPYPYGAASPTVTAGSTLNLGSVTKPTNSAPGGGGLEFHVKSGSTHCTVNSSSGQVTAVSAGSCTIEARFAAVVNKYSESAYNDVAVIRVQ